MSPASVSDFKAVEASGYDALADVFDRLSERFSGVLAERLLSLAQPKPGERVLDVGTGAGLVALRAAPSVAPGGRVVGVDIAQGMLARAREKAREARLEHVRFEPMDAEALDLEPASFDLVLSLFALPHFPDPARAVAEMFRVLRPGGRLVVAVGSRAPLGLRSAVRALVARFQQRLGRRLVAPAFLLELMERHLPESHDAPEPPAHLGSGEVGALLERAGFVGLRQSWYGQEAALESAQDLWDVGRTFSSEARRRLAGLSDEQLTPLRRELFERCEAVLAAGGRLAYPYGAALLSGARPGADGRD